MPTALIQISSEKEKKHENVRFSGESVWESIGEGEESTAGGWLWVKSYMLGCQVDK